MISGSRLALTLKLLSLGPCMINRAFVESPHWRRLQEKMET